MIIPFYLISSSLHRIRHILNYTCVPLLLNMDDDVSKAIYTV
jgi:hypothetical protein